MSTEKIKLKLGDRVRVEGFDCEGVIRFKGKQAHEGASQGKNRIGVELDEPVGKNNGTVDGHMYFKTKKKRGVFVAPKKVTLVPTKAQTTSDESTDVKVGDRVQVTGYDCLGTVRFIGPLNDEDVALRIGVELDKPIGKNDGTVSGRTYFSCADKHGVITRPKKIQIVEKNDDTSAIASDNATKGKGKSNSVKVGDRVQVEGYDCVGTVRALAKHPKTGNDKVGVELDAPIGKHNGTAQGHTYFTCKDKHGIVVAPKKVKLTEDTLAEHAATGEEVYTDPKLAETSNEAPATQEELYEDPKLAETQKQKGPVEVGQRVRVEGFDVPGTVRFVGKHHETEKNRIGVELDEALGKSSGKFQGHQYFSCPKKHGVLVAPKKVTLLQEGSTPKEEPSDQPQEVLNGASETKQHGGDVFEEQAVSDQEAVTETQPVYENTPETTDDAQVAEVEATEEPEAEESFGGFSESLKTEDTQDIINTQQKNDAKSVDAQQLPDNVEVGVGDGSRTIAPGFITAELTVPKPKQSSFRSSDGSGLKLDMKKPNDGSGKEIIIVKSVSGPAADVGTIEPGMHVLKIDGESTEGLSVSQCKKLLSQGKVLLKIELYDPRVQVVFEESAESIIKAAQEAEKSSKQEQTLNSPSSKTKRGPSKGEKSKQSSDGKVTAFYSESVKRMGNIRIENDRDKVAKVVLVFEGTNVEFPKGQTVELVVPAGGSTESLTYVKRTNLAEAWPWDFEMEAISDRLQTDTEELAPIAATPVPAHWITAAAGPPTWATQVEGTGVDDEDEEVFDGFGNTTTDSQGPEIMKVLTTTAAKQNSKPDVSTPGGKISIVGLWRQNFDKPQEKSTVSITRNDERQVEKEQPKKTSQEGRASSFDAQKAQEAESKAMRYLERMQR